MRLRWACDRYLRSYDFVQQSGYHSWITARFGMTTADKVCLFSTGSLCEGPLEGDQCTRATTYLCSKAVGTCDRLGSGARSSESPRVALPLSREGKHQRCCKGSS